MCKLKSGIILKDRVYIPDHDHHTQMLDELKIKDTRENAERLFVRAELLPQRRGYIQRSGYMDIPRGSGYIARLVCRRG